MCHQCHPPAHNHNSHLLCTRASHTHSHLLCHHHLQLLCCPLTLPVPTTSRANHPHRPPPVHPLTLLAQVKSEKSKPSAAKAIITTQRRLSFPTSPCHLHLSCATCLLPCHPSLRRLLVCRPSPHIPSVSLHAFHLPAITHHNGEQSTFQKAHYLWP